MNPNVITQQFTISVYAPNDTGSGSMNQYKLVKVDVVIDMAAIALDIARKAYFNKSKKAKMMNGAVVVRVVQS